MGDELRSDNSNVTILDQITPRTFVNMSAFTYSTYYPYDEDSDISKVVVFQRGDLVYTFVASFEKDNYNVDVLDKMINSIKFID